MKTTGGRIAPNLKVRAKVELVFRVLKCQFGFAKMRYRGLAKNANHVLAVFALGEHRAGEAAPVTIGTDLVHPQVAERP